MDHHHLLLPLIGGLRPLFNLAGLTLALVLRIRVDFLGLFRLFIAGFDAHLQRSFSFRIAVVQIDVLLNADLSFDPIHFTD